MASIFLNPDEQGLVVFKTWKSLQYQTRLAISVPIIHLGFVIQYLTFAVFPGIILILVGNLLLLPKGITNLDRLGIFDPESNWEKVEAHKLDDYLTLDRKIRKWDLSTIDASNLLGGFIFAILLLGFIIMTLVAFFDNNQTLTIAGMDAIVLLLPFWLTGFRSIFTVSQLTMKVKLIKRLMEKAAPRLQAHNVEYYFMMRGKDKRIPMDVKFRVNIAGQRKDFLGFYGQITINGPSGGVPYPYFYVVLVAKKGFGLANAYEGYNMYLKIKMIKKEFKNQDDVEVLVLRQNTDGVSMGYRTTDKQAETIFLEGLTLAEKVAV
jgi:hypothetical protein